MQVKCWSESKRLPELTKSLLAFKTIKKVFALLQSKDTTLLFKGYRAAILLT